MTTGRIDDDAMQTFLMMRNVEAEAIAAALRGDAFAVILDGASLPTAIDAATLARVYIGVAPPDAPDGRASLERAMALRPAGLVVRGVVTGADVTLTDARLAVIEAEGGLTDGATRIIAVAGSTPAALFAMDTLMGCSPRLAGLIHDPVALARALAAEDPADLQRIARALTVAAAHAAGVVAIDGDVRIDAETARREGFGGKLVAAPPD